jgi:hypothetical protein
VVDKNYFQEALKNNKWVLSKLWNNCNLNYRLADLGKPLVKVENKSALERIVELVQDNRLDQHKLLNSRNLTTLTFSFGRTPIIGLTEPS